MAGKEKLLKETVDGILSKIIAIVKLLIQYCFYGLLSVLLVTIHHGIERINSSECRQKNVLYNNKSQKIRHKIAQL